MDVSINAGGEPSDAVRWLERVTVPKLRRMLDEGIGKRKDSGKNGDK